jgi:3-keto-5-aminohexanoate cleavage enzyme
LIDAGLMSATPHMQFVMGVQNAMPADEHLLDILLAETRRVIQGATWTAAGIGRFQTPVMNWALARGADAVRTGMEDNIRVARDRLTTGNAELVGIAADIIAQHGGRPATPAEARAALRLRAA